MASIVRLIRQIRSLLLDALDARPKKKNHALAFLLPTRTRDESIQNQQRRSNHYTWAHTSDNPRSKLWRNSGMITRCANCISLLRWRLPPQIQSDRGGVYRSKYKIGRASYNWVSRVTAERERGVVVVSEGGLISIRPPPRWNYLLGSERERNGQCRKNW